MPTNSSSAPKRNLLTTLLGLLGMSGIAGVLVAAMMTPLIAVAGVTTNSTITLFESLPSYLEIQPLQQKTELYGLRGGQPEKFAEFYAQNRVEVPLDQISDNIKNAVIATEDPRFYQHGGVDVVSATRALMVSVLGDDGGGASTITMQYVRNQRVQAAEAILDPVQRQEAYDQANEQSIARKLQEMRLAIGVEKQYTKDQILNGYLNIALFGGTVYGVESAAQYYFGKSAKDVTLPEGALIAGMVQNPNAFNIDDPDHIQAATDRRNYVLKRMLEEKKITQDEYTEAVNTPIEPNITPSQQNCNHAKGSTGFFCNYVQLVMQQDPAFGATLEERQFNFRTKGYQIQTTLDLDLQDQATSAMNTYMPKSDPDMDLGAALSMVVPGTGEIVAMVQNKDFDETDAAAQDPTVTSVNYNTDMNYGGSSGFQVGSTYKIFTLANWLQSGHSLYEQINSRNRTFNLANFQDSCLGSARGGTWTPQNDGNQKFSTMNAVQATAQSVNTAFIAMGEKLDQCVTKDIALSMGVHRADPNAELETFPSDILGSGANTIAPLSMATAVAGFANKGVSCSPIAIKSISLHDGTEIAPPKSDCKQGVSEAVAAAVDFAMKTVMDSGTGTASNPGLGPIIGKSGTTDNAKDTWVITSTTGIATAMWVGNVTGKVSQYNMYPNGNYMPSIRHLVTHEVLAYAIPKYGAEAFPEPDESALKVENVTVPDVSGMSIEQARATLEAAGFIVDQGAQVDSEFPAGTVAQTTPSANTSVPKGSVVTVAPSSGKKPGGKPTLNPDQFTMPNVTGKTVKDAQIAIEAAGFVNNGSNLVMYEQKGDGAPGTVWKTDPPSGSATDKNATVSLYVNP